MAMAPEVDYGISNRELKVFVLLSHEIVDVNELHLK